MTAEEAKKLDHFFCESCSSEGQKKLQNSQSTSRLAETKVFVKLQNMNAFGQCDFGQSELNNIIPFCDVLNYPMFY